MSSLGWVQEGRPNKWRARMPKESGPTRAGQDAEARAEAGLAKATATGSGVAAAAYLRQLKTGAQRSGDAHPVADDSRSSHRRVRSRSPGSPARGSDAQLSGD